MKWLVAMVVTLGTLSACSERSTPTTDEIAMYPVEVGTKTDLYEVVAANELKLAPGVRFQVVEGSHGKNSGIVLLRPNGATGGYMECGCIGAQTSSCITESDNPDHPSCGGNCTDSEGNAHPCSLFGPLIGPPKDPFRVKFLARPTSKPAPGGGSE